MANFNSTLVRLRVLGSTTPVPPHSFQFHIGAIKREFEGLLLYKTPLFQFHIGAIKSLVLLFYIACFHPFQFHIGAIKSLN